MSFAVLQVTFLVLSALMSICALAKTNFPCCITTPHRGRQPSGQAWSLHGPRGSPQGPRPKQLSVKASIYMHGHRMLPCAQGSFPESLDTVQRLHGSGVQIHRPHWKMQPVEGTQSQMLRGGVKKKHVKKLFNMLSKHTALCNEVRPPVSPRLGSAPFSNRMLTQSVCCSTAASMRGVLENIDAAS